jgi:uncharacterized protein YutE (UPF0331/DUF86 family)
MNDIILNKCAIIEICIKRVEEEYRGFENEFFTNLTKQDSILLNIERAVQAAIDAGTHIIKKKKLGLPQSSREIFDLLSEHDIIRVALAISMKKMVGFRNIASRVTSQNANTQTS